MREINFRAWDPVKKEMWLNQFCITSYGCINQRQVAVEYISWKNEDWILLQYTGLKDRNGNKIFESDIIRLDDLFYKSIEADRLMCLVGFKESAFMYGRNEDYTYMNSYLWMAQNYCTVVGNIYQNPELLENNK